MSQLFVDTIRNRDGNGAPTFDKGVVISGIITASGSLAGDSVSIGVTEVVSSGFELKNIIGLDATTTAAIESAIALAPNDFASLNVSGVSTFGSNIDLNANIDIFGHTETSTLNATGILTAALLSTGTEGSAIRISSNTISGPATITIDPAGIGTNTGTVVINGDLQVDGDTTTVNSTTLTVDDKNIILASGSLTDASSDGGGITLESGEGNKTINWVDSTDSWTFSENVDIASGKTFKINGTDVLSATTLGSSVVNSSLTSLGTLTGLTVSGAINANGDLDVDGHTELDNVNVSGVATIFEAAGAELNLTRNTSGLGSNLGFKFKVNNPSGNSTTLGITRILGNTSVLNLDDQGVIYPSASNQVDLGKTSNRFENFYGLNIDASGDLDVDGHTNLDNVSIAGVVTAGQFVGDGSGLTSIGIGTTGSINTSGIITATGIDLNGDLDVDGHTNLDNVSVAGVSTFQGNINLGDSDEIRLGDSNDLTISHAGFGRIVSTGVLTVSVDDDINLDIGSNVGDTVNIRGGTGSSETLAVFALNGSVDLYYDNSKKFETTGAGVTVFGTTQTQQLNVSGVSTFNNDVNIPGNRDIIMGGAADDTTGALKIYNNSNRFFEIFSTSKEAYIRNTGSNANGININANTSVVMGGGGSGGFSVEAASDGTAKLYGPGPLLKLQTTTSGVSITGTSTCTGSVQVGSGQSFGSSTGSAAVYYGNLTGDVTGNADTATNASGLTGTPNIDCGTGSFTGDVDIADKIIHTGDTNTAIRFPAADTFSVETAGSERFRIASAGQIGLGGANYGSATQVLTSNGSSAAPTWEDAAAGGAMVLISTSTFTSSTASVDFTGISGYSRYQIIFSMETGASAGTLRMRVGIDGTYDTGSNYNVAGALETSMLVLGGFSATSKHGEINITNLNQTERTAVFTSGVGESTDGSSHSYQTSGGGHRTATAQNSITLFGSGGNLSSGVVALYGVKYS